MKNLPDEEVNIKLSVCNKCNDIVTASVEHMMDRKIKNEFAKEVMKYNLNVKSIPLLEYRKMDIKFCKCKN